MARRRRAALAACAVAVALGGCVAPPPAPAPSATPSSLIDSIPGPAPTPQSGPPGDAVPRGSFLFYEDFEAGTDRWVLPRAEDRPVWRLLQAFTCGGAYTMLLGLPERAAFTPAAGTSVLALAEPLDLTKAGRPTLKFDVLASAEPPEAMRLYAEAREPGGEWQPLGEPLSARYPIVRSIVRELTGFAGKQAEFRFRAVLEAGTAESRGLLLDDVQVIEPG